MLLLRRALSVLAFAFSMVGAAASPARDPHQANPILPGYYADPSLVQFEGESYLYATLDPWGGETLGCWESADFKNWTYRELNWPTKQACTSKTSGDAKVWAPSVVRAPNGKFFMYVSVGSEVWVGTSDHPLGPWRDAHGGKPLIDGKFRPGYHMIDAEAFLDDDGTAYLYWGSGWNWVKGRCFAVKLKPDMVTFDGKVRDVTPANYFEGPFMVKHDGRYFLTYSQGKTIDDTYQVHYAVGDTPFGPFTEGANSPILVTDKTNDVVSPGHHAIFARGGKTYILYHRHSVPYDPAATLRQTCVDELEFTADHQIAKVAPTHVGPALVSGRLDGRKNLVVAASASSTKDANAGAESVFDDNYATRWAAAPDAAGGWLQVDLGKVQDFSRQELRFEYAWKSYPFRLEASNDGTRWQTLRGLSSAPVVGSPVVIQQAGRARYLRLVFPPETKGADLSLFEWNVFSP